MSGGDFSPYLKLDSTAGSKIPLDITRVLQGIQVITKDAFQDHGAKSIGKIMKQVPSATALSITPTVLTCPILYDGGFRRL